MDSPESQVKIQIHCPQCGGQIDFLEEAQAFRCQFCGSTLLIAGREGVLRYVFKPHIPDAQAAQVRAAEQMRTAGKRPPRKMSAFLFYAPFWRLQGTVYRWVFGAKPMKVEIDAGVPPPMDRLKVFLYRILDHTIPGYADLDFGVTNLGIRAQAAPLQAFSQEHLEMRDSFLPLEVPHDAVEAEVDHFSRLFFEREDVIPEVTLHQVVGRKYSVIYFPFWCVEYEYADGRETLLLDGMGGNLTRTIPDVSSIRNKLTGEDSRKSFEFSEIRFLPFRCPNCGWDFPFYPLAHLHFCPNCRRLYRERAGEWAEAPYAVLPRPESQGGEQLLWVPFWRCRTLLQSGEEKLDNMAGLYRLAPPMRVVDAQKEALRPIYFYIPAVKFRDPRVIHNLASRLTYSQPDLNLGTFSDGAHPLTPGGSLPETDARQMGAVILGALIPQNNRRARAWLNGCRVELQDPQIIYLPFTRADLFWKEKTTGISFQHNALPEDLPGKKT